MKIIIDERFKQQIPPLSTEERALLEDSIKAEGLRDSLTVWKTKDGLVLLDGHNRYEICQKLKIIPHVFEMFLDSREHAEDWIDKNQLGRRNLSPDDFRMILGRRYNRQKKKPTGFADRDLSGGQSVPRWKTAETLAAEHGVSDRTVKRAGQYAAAVDAVTQEQPELAGMGPDAIKEAARKRMFADAATKREEQKQQQETGRKLTPEERKRMHDGIQADVKDLLEKRDLEARSRISVYSLEGWLSSIDRHLACCKSRTEKIEHLQDMIKACRKIVVDMQKEATDAR